MFGKLMKHEFRATARIIPLSWAAMIVITALYVLVNKLEIEWLTGTSVIFVVVAVVAVSIIALLVVAARFYQTMYKNESYLTHTLPVTSGQILLSKVLVGVFWIFTSLLLTLGGIAVIFAPLYDTMPELQAIVEFVLGWIKQVGVVPVIAAAVLMGLLSCMESVAHIYTAVTLGNLPGNQKHSLALSVVFYLLINQVLTNAFGILVLVLPPALRFTPSGVSLVMAVPLTSLMNIAEAGVSFFDYGITGLILQYAADIVLLLVVKKLLDKKLSVR